MLLSPEDTVISDELNHASIIDGIRLCKAKKMRYKHKDMQGSSFKIQSTEILMRDTVAIKLHVYRLGRKVKGE